MSMTVMECARRLMENDWEGVDGIEVKTLGYALEMIEIFEKNSKRLKSNETILQKNAA
jgi:hypothetical protein